MVIHVEIPVLWIVSWAQSCATLALSSPGPQARDRRSLKSRGNSCGAHPQNRVSGSPCSSLPGSPCSLCTGTELPQQSPDRGDQGCRLWPAEPTHRALPTALHLWLAVTLRRSQLDHQRLPSVLTRALLPLHAPPPSFASRDPVLGPSVGGCFRIVFVILEERCWL